LWAKRDEVKKKTTKKKNIRVGRMWLTKKQVMKRKKTKNKSIGEKPLKNKSDG